jgi:hypothetical protein
MINYPNVQYYGVPSSEVVAAAIRWIEYADRGKEKPTSVHDFDLDQASADCGSDSQRAGLVQTIAVDTTKSKLY